jgi:hypothetical protein
VSSESDFTKRARLWREGSGTAFVVLRVKPDDKPPYNRILGPAACRIRFRNALLGVGEMGSDRQLGRASASAFGVSPG